MRHSLRHAAALCALLFSPIAGAVDIHDTRLLTQPAISTKG